MINEMEWSEVDWDAERWTVPAAKMKTGWDRASAAMLLRRSTSSSPVIFR
jgi:hypothetical protein